MKWTQKKGFKRVVVPLLVLTMAFPAVPGASGEAEAADSRLSISADNISAKSANAHEAALMVDGNTQTYWQSIPSDGGGDDYAKMYDHNRYIDIELDGTYDLSEIKIYNNVDGSYNNYYVYASADGVNYDKIISKTSDAPAAEQGDDWQIDVSASYLRLNMAYNSASFATNLAEIEVYGTKTSSQVKAPQEIKVEDWQGSTWQKEWDRFESDQAYAQEKVLGEMSELVGRVLGSKWKSSFRFETRKSLKEGSDIFELKDGENGTIVIRGNNGIAMASGFNYYLKNYGNVDYNPIYESNVDFEKIVPVGKTIIKEAQFDLRYALNFCTYSYSMSFWNWDEYEQFLDWCAMNSVNLVLDIVGQEEVIRQTLREFHYTDEEIKDYICGPAYFGWFYMQNMYSAGGPLPNAWFEQRVELGRKMHDRMQTYGIQPVIQGFAGQVPETFAEKNEGAVLTPADSWGGYVRPSIIKTYLTDAEKAAGKVNYFSQAAETFYEKQKNVFGDVSDYYATDPFHEGGKIGSLDIAAIFQEVQNEMLKSNPDAVWVLHHWQDPDKATKMSKMDVSKTLSLDLQTDMNPQYGVFESNGGPWLYCMLHNFGGRMGLDGEIPVIAADPIDTFNSTKNMKGIGITPEGLENSPVVYELFFDTVWSKDPIDYNKWTDKYAQRRSGGTSDSLQEAWDILLETAYADKGIYYQGAAETVINAVPSDSFKSASVWGHSNILYDKKKLDQALLLLLENYDDFSSSPAYKYDLADVAEQVLCNAAVEYHALMVEAKNYGDLEKFEELSSQFLALIDLSDQILSTAKKFMVGTWIQAARKMITDADDWTKDLFEYNARSLITTWGGERAATSGGLNDYSNRKWAGLTGSYYKTRWEIWVRNRIADLKGEERDPADEKAENNWFLWEYQWVNRKSDDNDGAYAYSTVPSDADLEALARQAYEDFSCTNLEKNTGSSAQERRNVAEGKPVASVSETDSGSLENITDGDTGTEWTAKGEGPHVVEIDLEGTYEIEEIVLSIPQLAKLFPYTYLVEGAGSDGTWTKIAEYTDRAMQSNVMIPASGKVQKIRVTMTTSDAADSPVTLTEVAVYGKEAEETYVNLAEGILATTNKTNTDGGFPLGNITDGITTNLWKTADWGPGAYPADIKVTLPEAAYADYIGLYFEKAGLPFIFYVTVTDESGQEVEVFAKYKDGDNYPKVGTERIMDAAFYKIDVNQKITDVTVHMTGITEEGAAYAAGPALAELMIMSSQTVQEEPEVCFPANEISGITASGEVYDSQGNTLESALDKDTATFVRLTEPGENTGSAEITFDLGKNYFVDHAEITFEKGELGLKYQVIAVAEDGTRTTVFDKSDTAELLGNPVVTVPVRQEVKQLIFVHMGNNGQGPAYAAERRLYEFAVFGIANVSKGAEVETSAANAKNLTDGSKVTVASIDAEGSVTLTLKRAVDVSMVSALRAFNVTSNHLVRYKAEYYDEDAQEWKLFADMTDNSAEDAEIYAISEQAVVAKQIRFTFAEWNTYAELRVYAVDHSGVLEERIRAIQAILEELNYDGYNGSYSAEARKVLEGVLAEAEEAIEEGLSSAEADEWIDKVNAALRKFYVDGVVYVDRTDLLVALSDAAAMMEELESAGEDDAKAVLESAVKAAREVYDTYQKTQADIEAAKERLEMTMENLLGTMDLRRQAKIKIAEAQKRRDEAVVGDVNGNYTQKAANTLAAEILQAEKDLAAAVSEEEIQAVIDKIQAAMDAFEEGRVTVDKSELDAEIRLAKELEDSGADYEPDTWEAFEEALSTAKEISAAEAVSQKQIDDAKEVLHQAREGLVRLITLPYTDVQKDDWFYPYVKDVYVKGLMTGMNDTTFAPNGNLVRAQFAVILWRMEGSPEVNYEERFPDVPAKQFYTEAVLWAASEGIVTGYTNTGMFGPSDNITREQMAVMMHRYAKYKGYEVSGDVDLNSFPDHAKVTSFAEEAMKWCVAQEIITGDGGSLNPQGNTNRAVCATIISRYSNTYK